jgi:hypothetical protein
VIVAVGSDKGSPGATTLAAALGAVWPGERVVCELDPRGADLPYRLLRADGRPLAEAPSIAALAVDARPGSGAPRLERYAQPTVLGAPVIPGELSTRRTGRLAGHFPAIGRAGAGWAGTMLADLGWLQPMNPALVVAKSAAAVLLVVRADVEGLGHLRDRVEELAEFVGDPARLRPAVGVVVRAAGGDAVAAVERARRLLGSIGSPSPVLGAWREDPAACRGFWAGAPGAGRKWDRNPLIRSARELADSVLGFWPQLGAAALPQAASVAAPAYGPPADQPDWSAAAGGLA